MIFRPIFACAVLAPVLFSTPAQSEDSDPPEEPASCNDILTDSRQPKADFVLSDPVVQDSFRWFRDVGSAGMRARLYESPNTPLGREAFQQWVFELLNSKEILYEIGLLSEEEYQESESAHAPMKLDLDGVDLLIDQLSLDFMVYSNIKSSGYQNYPKHTDEDGYTFNRFESWAIKLQSIYDEAREKHLQLNEKFHDNFDASMTLQKRVDNIVRHTAQLVGARQEIFEYLILKKAPAELRVILETTVPEIGRRIFQLHTAFIERNAQYIEVTERVIRQKDRIMALDDLLSKMDE